jgi:uncharacterized membrane protein
LRLGDEDRQLIARCIRELEARTQAEVVLVLREKSGSYRDVSYLAGAFAAFFALGLALYLPLEFHPLAIPVPILAAFWVTGWLCQHSRIRVRLTTPKRRREQVAKAAAAAFFEKNVFDTSSRMGVLVYFSRFENEALILTDLGARACLDPARLEEYRVELSKVGKSEDRVRALGTFLRSFGVYLGRVLPWDEATRGAKKDELSDAPDTAEEDE